MTKYRIVTDYDYGYRLQLGYADIWYNCTYSDVKLSLTAKLYLFFCVPAGSLERIEVVDKDLEYLKKIMDLTIKRDSKEREQQKLEKSFVSKIVYGPYP